MDLTNPEIWKQQWTAFMSAPYIMALPVLVAGWVGWWLRGNRSAGTIDGLRERISALEERWRLADDKAAASDRAKDDVEKQFQAYKAEAAAAKADTAALAAAAERVEAALVKFAAANNAVRSTLSGTLNITEEPDRVDFRVVP
jgi:hypothetical protein